MFSLFWPHDLRVRDLGRLDPSTLCTPQCSVRACTGVVMHVGKEYEGGTDKGFCRYRPRGTHKKGLGRVTHTSASARFLASRSRRGPTPHLRDAALFATSLSKRL